LGYFHAPTESAVKARPDWCSSDSCAEPKKLSRGQVPSGYSLRRSPIKSSLTELRPLGTDRLIAAEFDAVTVAAPPPETVTELTSGVAAFDAI
jgi:hypothetical protein